MLPLGELLRQFAVGASAARSWPSIGLFERVRSIFDMRSRTTLTSAACLFMSPLFLTGNLDCLEPLSPHPKAGPCPRLRTRRVKDVLAIDEVGHPGASCEQSGAAASRRRGQLQVCCPWRVGPHGAWQDLHHALATLPTDSLPGWPRFSIGLLTANGSRSRHFRCQESCTRRVRVNATHATPPKTTTTTSNSGRWPPTKPIECLQYPRSSPDVRRLGGSERGQGFP